MKIIIEIPDYAGDGMDVFWDLDSKYAIDIQEKSVVLSANKNGLISLAKQMLYMAYNKLPLGSHIHFDSFFTNIGEEDLELVIEVT